MRAAVAALPNLDAIVLNAGGLLGEQLTMHGVTQNFAGNVLGHVVLVEGLLAASKIRECGTTRVCWVASDGLGWSRPVGGVSAVSDE